MTAEDISDSGDRTYDHGPEHVVIYILVRSVVSADDRNETAAEEGDQQTEGNRGGDPRVKAEGEGLSGIREILAAQSPGNDAGAADAEEVGDGCQEYQVSAKLYIILMSCVMIVGTASVMTATGIGADSKMAIF